MCPVIFRRRRGHPGKPLTGELEPVSQTTRQVIKMLGSPVLQGAVQAGDLLALGTRSSASRKGVEVWPGLCSRAMEKPEGDLRSPGSISWIMLPFLPSSLFSWLGDCVDSRGKVGFGAAYLQYFNDSISLVEAQGSSLLFPLRFACSAPLRHNNSQQSRGRG